jgi:hypothetical protein
MNHLEMNESSINQSINKSTHQDRLMFDPSLDLDQLNIEEVGTKIINRATACPFHLDTTIVTSTRTFLDLLRW